MAIASARSLVEILSRGRLLEPEQLAELTRTLPARPADPLALARELVGRGWLTPYQVNQLFQGHADDLVLGHYVLLERLGEGGMGQVFKAREQRLGRVVALKVLRRDQMAKPDTVRRFRQEVEAAARLSHPNIVHAYDAEEVGGTQVFAMEYVEGIDLARLVKRAGPLPVPLACDYVRQAAQGLQHVHDNSMVHRDIKPANLMRSNHGDIIKILDMGLARLLDDGTEGPAAGKLTRLGAIMGTVDYMAPEQALSSRKADIRSDLYSLGCSFYFLLIGRVPFPVDEPMAKLLAHQCDAAVPVDKLRPEVSPAVAAVVRKLMAKNPSDRYQTPAELVRDLSAPHAPPAAPVAQKVEAPSPVPRPPVPGRTPPRAARRDRPWIAAAGVTLLLLLLAGLGYLLLTGGGPAPSRDETPGSREAAEGEIINSLGMKLVLIPAGKFFMGSPADEPHHRDDESPSHGVTLTQPFYLGAHPVTAGNFRAFVAATGHKTTAEKAGPNGPTWINPGWKHEDDSPAVCLSWDDARAFCDWLGRKEGRTYRLPTEAEWEYACRAGSTSAYCYGPDARKLDEYAWHRGNSGGKAQPVGRKKPNAWGLFDVHGNVQEWCGDYYDRQFYQKLGIEDPRGPARGGRRVLRGGSWRSSPHECRSAHRASAPPGEHRNDYGFRVVLVTSG